MLGKLTVIVTVSMLWTASALTCEEQTDRNPQKLEGLIITNVADTIWLKTNLSLHDPRIVQVKDECDENGIFNSHRCFDVYIAENKSYRCKVMLAKHALGFDYARCAKK